MKPGTFSGLVKVTWLEGPRDMQLFEELKYRDLNGRMWIALKGAIINGASIPKFFWRIVGSPFVGLYRRPSVIHDVYCGNQLRPAQEVHDVFKEMMFQEGVSTIKVKAMFNAVNTFGPRW